MFFFLPFLLYCCFLLPFASFCYLPHGGFRATNLLSTLILSIGTSLQFHLNTQCNCGR